MSKPAPRSIRRIYPNVTKCVDAKRPVAVTVMPKDTSGAEAKSFSTCAMARAICREWKADHALIGLSYSYVIKGNSAIRFSTPETVQREIVAFDRTKNFSAGTYHLAPVSPAMRLGVSHKKKKPSGKKTVTTGHNAKRVRHETLGVRKMRDLGAAA